MADVSSGAESGGIEVPLEVEAEVPAEPSVQELEQEALESNEEAEPEAEAETEEGAGEATEESATEEPKGRTAKRIQELLADRGELRQSLAAAQQAADNRYNQLVSYSQQQQKQLADQVAVLNQQLWNIQNAQNKVSEANMSEAEKLERGFISKLQSEHISPVEQRLMSEIQALKSERQQERAAASYMSRFNHDMDLTKQHAAQTGLKGLKDEYAPSEFKERYYDTLLAYGAAGAAQGRAVDIPSSAKEFSKFLDDYYVARLRSSVKVKTEGDEGQVATRNTPRSPVSRAARQAPVVRGAPRQSADKPPQGADISALLDWAVSRQPEASI